MEFLFYLSPAGQEIYNMISRKVRVVENAPICRQYDIYGWYDPAKNVMTVCTNKIQSTTSNVQEYGDETIFHESAHIAQACKSGKGYIKEFGISISQMPLTDRRKKDITSAVKINGNEVRHIEHEAFWMEDKPNKVKYVLQKYCF